MRDLHNFISTLNDVRCFYLGSSVVQQKTHLNSSAICGWEVLRGTVLFPSLSNRVISAKVNQFKYKCGEKKLPSNQAQITSC